MCVCVCVCVRVSVCMHVCVLCNSKTFGFAIAQTARILDYFIHYFNNIQEVYPSFCSSTV